MKREVLNTTAATTASTTTIRLIAVLSEQHSLMDDQLNILNNWLDKEVARLPQFDASLERWDIPAEGLTLEGIRELANRMANTNAVFVIVSPVPALFAELFRLQKGFFVLHNDKREAREVPDGKGGKKIVHVVAAEGWQLV